MSLEIANLFYNKVSQRLKHPTIHNVPIKHSDLNIKCSDCKMVGHKIIHCCEGLREIVKEHGPNLCSKSTHVLYPGDTYDKNRHQTLKSSPNTTWVQQKGTAKVYWKERKSFEENTEKGKYKKLEKQHEAISQQKLEDLLSSINKTDNFNGKDHLSSFTSLIRENDTLLSMGNSNWRKLEEIQKERGDETPLPSKSQISNLAVYKIIESQLLGFNKFNGTTETILTITSFFILKHHQVLLHLLPEKIKKMNEEKSLSEEDKKKKISQLSPEKIRDEYDYIINKESHNKCCLIPIFGRPNTTNNDVIQGSNKPTNSNDDEQK